MTLSPAAQAVLDAYWKSPWDPSLQHEDRYAIAAALRAAVDQVVPLYSCNTSATRGQTRLEVRHKLLALADELEQS